MLWLLHAAGCGRVGFAVLGDGGGSGDAGSDGPAAKLCPTAGIVAGKRHTCALRDDGTVACWGANDEDQLALLGGADAAVAPVDIPLPAPATSIASGLRATCALLTDRSVRCWGDNYYGELGDGTTMRRTGVIVMTLPPGSATAIAASAQSGCAITPTGGAICWGNDVATPTPAAVAGVSGATEIAMGHRFACTRDATGAVTCWGANTSGQLGRGTTSTGKLPPDLVSGLTDATALYGGGRFACAQRASGGVSCWGNNDSGELGLGSYNANKTTPVSLPLPDVRRVSGGARFACAMLADAHVMCWGEGSRGERGTGDFRLNPGATTAVGGLDPAMSIASGAHHTCALLHDGTVRCWGDNSHGQLGTGARTASSTPVTAMVPLGASKLVSGRQRTCVVYDTGDIYCWGDGVLGDGTDGWDGVPVHVGTSGGAAATGHRHVCIIDATSKLQCWGDNNYGQLGDGTFTGHYSPAATSGGLTVTQVSSGGNHVCAVSGTSVYCWGNNASGQIGDNTQTDRNQPTLVQGLSGTPTLTGGGYDYSCAISSNNVYCWGSNSNGQLGDGTTTPHLTAAQVTGLSAPTNLAVGAHHACAVVAAGLRCWGQNDNGQLGDGTTTDRTQPVAVTLQAPVVSIAAGENHTCAALTDQTVWCWGANGGLQLGSTFASASPLQVMGLAATRVSAGTDQTCALATDGTTRCWGNNSEGQLGDGTGISDALPRATAFVCP